MQTVDLEAIAAENCLDAVALGAFEDSYLGTFGSLEGWAKDYLENAGGLEAMPENLRRYFDLKRLHGIAA